MEWGFSDTTLILAAAILMIGVLARQARPITRELISLAGLALAAGLIATENHATVALMLAGLTLARAGIARKHPGVSALILGLVGIAGAFLGHKIAPGTPVEITLGGIAFVHITLKPIAFFAALQLILLNPRIESAYPLGARPPARIAFSIAALAVALAFGFGLATGGIAVSPQKLTALSGLTPSFMILIIAHAALIALIEESLFRGAIQPLARAWLTARMPARIPLHYAETAAVLVAAVLFGLVHFKLGPAWMVGAMIGGIGYGYAYAARRRLMAPVLIHALVVVVLTVGMVNG